ncbi:MAG: cysteine peptidase family C39 domain-containing protein [Butyricimonas faecihominis]
MGLIEASNKLGLLAKGKSLTDGLVKLDSLLRIPKPAIAHVLVNDKLLHFVVIYDVTKKYVKIMDPAYGEFKKVLIKDFVKEWTGILILVMPDSDFKAGDMRISTFNRFAYLLKPHRKMVIQAILGAMVCTLLGLVSSIYMQKLIDYVIPDGRNLLNMVSILMLVIMFVSTNRVYQDCFYAENEYANRYSDGIRLL